MLTQSFSQSWLIFQFIHQLDGCCIFLRIANDQCTCFHSYLNMREVKVQRTKTERVKKEKQHPFSNYLVNYAYFER